MGPSVSLSTTHPQNDAHSHLRQAPTHKHPLTSF